MSDQTTPPPVSDPVPAPLLERRGCIPVVVGIVVILAGIPMLVCPGPGMVVIAAGVAMVAAGFGLSRRSGA